MSQSLTSKLLSWFIAILVGIGLIFLTLAIQRSRLPYNSEGNYFDGVINYHEQSVEAYGILSVVSFLVAIILFGIHSFMQRKSAR